MDGEPAVLGLVPADWVFHFAGVVLTDWACGGPHVNPGVSISFFCLGEIGAAQCAVMMIAQVVGASVAYLACQAIAVSFGWRPLVGPDFAPDAVGAACTAEFLAMLALCLVVYVANFVPPARVKAHRLFYFVKQGSTAIAIRGIILALPASGPAINPALALGWRVCAIGAMPPLADPFWRVYFVAPAVGGLVAAAAYALYAPGARLFGGALRKKAITKRKVA